MGPTIEELVAQMGAQGLTPERLAQLRAQETEGTILGLSTIGGTGATGRQMARQAVAERVQGEATHRGGLARAVAMQQQMRQHQAGAPARSARLLNSTLGAMEKQRRLNSPRLEYLEGGFTRNLDDGTVRLDPQMAEMQRTQAELKLEREVAAAQALGQVPTASANLAARQADYAQKHAADLADRYEALPSATTPIQSSVAQIVKGVSPWLGERVDLIGRTDEEKALRIKGQYFTAEQVRVFTGATATPQELAVAMPWNPESAVKNNAERVMAYRVWASAQKDIAAAHRGGMPLTQALPLFLGRHEQALMAEEAAEQGTQQSAQKGPASFMKFTKLPAGQ